MGKCPEGVSLNWTWRRLRTLAAQSLHLLGACEHRWAIGHFTEIVRALKIEMRKQMFLPLPLWNEWAVLKKGGKSISFFITHFFSTTPNPSASRKQKNPNHIFSASILSMLISPFDRKKNIPNLPEIFLWAAFQPSPPFLSPRLPSVPWDSCFPGKRPTALVPPSSVSGLTLERLRSESGPVCVKGKSFPGGRGVSRQERAFCKQCFPSPQPQNCQGSVCLNKKKKHI